MTYINNVNTCMPVYGCGHVHERDSVKKGKHCVLQCVSHVLIHASLYMKVFAFGACSMDSNIKWVYSPTSAQHLMDEKKN